MSLFLSCFPGYGPQGGSPVFSRRSCGTGFLCGLRCDVGPFALVGLTTVSLPTTTMHRSDSLLGLVRPFFLSSKRPTRLVLAVSTPGEWRASQVPGGSLFTCHALRPRQSGANLTFIGLLRFGFRTTNSVPLCTCCFEAGLLERGARHACGRRSSLCTLLGRRST